jgi:RecB family exonuclease
MPSIDPDSSEQLALFSPATKLFACTPSRINTYDVCPRRYRYTYVDRPAPPKGPPWAHNSLGASVHNVLKRWFELPVAQRAVDVLPKLAAAVWITDGYRDAEQVRDIFHVALLWLERYVGTLPPDEPVGVERTVAAKTATLALSGRVDRIDARGGELVIVDYKTGRIGLGQADAQESRALALYAFATQRLFHKTCRRVELHHLPTGTVRAHEHTDASIGRHVAQTEATAVEIQADREFPVRPGGHCSWCDYRAICPAGKDAEKKDPWVAVEKYESLNLTKWTAREPGYPD